MPTATLNFEGVGLDAETRCAHWHGPTDVLAIRFPCCDRWFACFECHAALADHPPKRWAKTSFGAAALACGVCRETFSVKSYLARSEACPACGAAFNPGCALHHHLYFEIP